MIEDVGIYINCLMQFFNLPITLYGFTFTLWQWFLFLAIGAIIIGFIYKLFDK